MNTFEMLLMIAGVTVGIAGISTLSHAVWIWRKMIRGKI